MPAPSRPYPSKVMGDFYETYLRMADIEYDIKTTLPLLAPKGKQPYIEDGDLKLADSRLSSGTLTDL